MTNKIILPAANTVLAVFKFVITLDSTAAIIRDPGRIEIGASATTLRGRVALIKIIWDGELHVSIYEPGEDGFSYTGTVTDHKTAEIRGIIGKGLADVDRDVPETESPAKIKVTCNASCTVDMTRDAYALNKIMEFEHVIMVHEDETVSTQVTGLWAPEVTMDVDSDGQATSEPETEGPWSLLTGWTGQCGYNGAHMRSSEFVGGHLARHILETPGFWVAVTVSPSDGSEPDGWALAHVDIDGFEVTQTD